MVVAIKNPTALTLVPTSAPTTNGGSMSAAAAVSSSAAVVRPVWKYRTNYLKHPDDFANKPFAIDALAWVEAHMKPEDLPRLIDAVVRGGFPLEVFRDWYATWGFDAEEAKKKYHEYLFNPLSDSLPLHPEFDPDLIFTMAIELGWQSTWVSNEELTTEAAKKAAVEAAKAIEAKADQLSKLRYRLHSPDELINAPPLKWMVRGVLPEVGLAALYGPPGSGKSFLALDLCVAVAGGTEWFERRTTAVPVIYVALEGEGGLGKRAKAWTTENNTPLPDRLRFVMQPFDLRQASDVQDLCEAVEASGGAGGLLVLDTLNRAAPGSDENSAADMGELLAACTEIRRRLGGVVLIIHHTGKDAGKGLRGHSSLIGALDAAIEVTRTGDVREWSVFKARDEVDGESNAFRLRLVEMGFDNEGDAITSCVVQHVDAEAMPAKMPKAVQELKAVYDEANPGLDGMTLSALLNAAKEKYGKGYRKDNAKRDLEKFRGWQKMPLDHVIWL